MKYDYVIVGSGFFGSVFAHEAKLKNKKVLVVEKRSHKGGNCYTKKIENINVHMYGPHIFHTNNQKIWRYINQFSRFNHYSHRVKAVNNNQIFSLPLNLMTMYQIFGVSTPNDAIAKIQEVKVHIPNPQNLEEFVLANLGQDIYDKLFYHYTKKQWGMEPKYLPSSIIQRLPIRMNFDDNYYNHQYQGMPINGYTSIFTKLLTGIDIIYNVDFLEDKKYFESIADKIVYTGQLDSLHNNKFGKLNYRSLLLKTEILDTTDFQGNSVINYTDDSKFTRIVEHKHFQMQEHHNTSKTVITTEYPQEYTGTNEPFYPINTKDNEAIYTRYKKITNKNKYIIGGRLGKYKYYDMDQIIASALKTINNYT